MSTVPKAKTLLKAQTLASTIRRECRSHSREEIGVVLTMLLVDFAQIVGMPKTHFMEMMNGAWDINGLDVTNQDEDEDEAKAEMH